MSKFRSISHAPHLTRTMTQLNEYEGKYSAFWIGIFIDIILDHSNTPNARGIHPLDNHPPNSSQPFPLSAVEQQSQHRPITPILTADKPPEINYSTYPSPGRTPPTINRATHPSAEMPSQTEISNVPKEECVSEKQQYDLLDIAQAEYDDYLRRLIRMEKRMENCPRAAVEYPDASMAMAHINLQRSARVLEMVKDYTIAMENEQYDLEMMRKWAY